MATRKSTPGPSRTSPGKSTPNKSAGKPVGKVALKASAKPLIRPLATPVPRPMANATSKASPSTETRPTAKGSVVHTPPKVTKAAISKAGKAGAATINPELDAPKASKTPRVAPWDLPPKTSKPAQGKKAAGGNVVPAPSVPSEDSKVSSPKRTKTQGATPTQRANSKQSVILDLLQGAGATLEQMMQATGWQAHSVRGMLSGVIRKRLGFEVQSSRAADGTRHYRIAGSASAAPVDSGANAA